MTGIKKPMLAASKRPNLDDITYPKLMSTKLDGIRCVIKGGEALSRTLKPIPNEYTQQVLMGLAALGLEGCDGELMVNGDFNAVQSAFMSHSGKPDFTFYVFDVHDYYATYKTRQRIARERVEALASLFVKFLDQCEVNSADEVNKAFVLIKEPLSV